MSALSFKYLAIKAHEDRVMRANGFVRRTADRQEFMKGSRGQGSSVRSPTEDKSMKSMNARSARRSFFLASLVVALLALSTAPLAQVGAPGMWKSYAAKFVCGAENGVLNSVIATGKYFTVVNIHNPHYLMDVTGAQVPAVFFKKVVVALPQGNMPLRPSCKQFEALSADHALSMDCFTIKTILRLDGLPFQGDLEGFMVIEVPPQPTQDDAAPELDVVAVYNARPRLGTDPDVRKFDVTTMDVERIVPTNIIGVPNQDLCSPD